MLIPVSICFDKLKSVKLKLNFNSQIQVFIKLTVCKRFLLIYFYYFLGGEVDNARVRFDTALQDLLHKDEISDSENESDSDVKGKLL